jgi:glycosyltransferase involved in cell wall biosynthesis
MKILFIHPNFPGQFKHLALHLAKDKKNEVVFACTYSNNVEIPGVKKIFSKPKRGYNKNIHRYLRGFEKANYAGQEMWRTCNSLKKTGFKPDVIYAHSGWGDALFVKDLFPDVPYISYMEFFCKPFGADVHFSPDEKVEPDNLARIRVKNATNLINLVSCDWAISPTNWQASLHPHEFHNKFSVIHEGIDTELIQPNNNPKPINLPSGTTLPKNAEIVTYVARSFEPYRGFEQVMKAIEKLMSLRPKAHFLMIGSDNVSYGSAPASGTYRENTLKELTLDETRIHWFGKLPYEEYLNVLQHSNCHIYLTVPFVLSWSILEAMAIGCPIVASNTKPVQEVIKNNKNGLLVDFFSPDEIAKAATTILNDRSLGKKLGTEARLTIIRNYSLQKIMPTYIKLIKDFAIGKNKPSNAQKMSPVKY